MLPFRGATLLEYVAGEVQAAAGSVTIVGPRHRYGHLPWPVEEDRTAGLGPLSGLETALAVTAADFNLVVACDMPAIEAAFLGLLLDEAQRTNADCLAPEGPRGPEPLCAVYHRRCLEALRRSIENGQLKLLDAIAGLRPVWFPVARAAWFENVNTPADWSNRKVHV